MPSKTAVRRVEVAKAMGRVADMDYLTFSILDFHGSILLARKADYRTSEN
jgi:hypothetical protein